MLIFWVGAGHSLGAALAILFAQVAACRELPIADRIAAVYGFAPPRVGDKEFARRFAATYNATASSGMGCWICNNAIAYDVPKGVSFSSLAGGPLNKGDCLPKGGLGTQLGTGASIAFATRAPRSDATAGNFEFEHILKGLHCLAMHSLLITTF